MGLGIRRQVMLMWVAAVTLGGAGLAARAARAEAASAGPSTDPASATAPAESPAAPASQPAEGEWLDEPVPSRGGAFSLRPVDLYLEAEGDYTARRVKLDGSRGPGRRQDNRDLYLRERMGLGLAGEALADDLLRYTADLEFGLSQTRFSERIDGWKEVEDDSGFLHAYDLSLDIAADKPFSLHGYARHGEERIPRRFLASLREVRTETGVSGLWTQGPFTTEFGLAWSDVERIGTRRLLDDEALEVSRFYVDHRWAISEDQQLRLKYDHDDENTRYQGSGYDFDTQHDELRLEHEIAFGTDRQHRLDTYLRYNDERGDLAHDEIEFVPQLRLKHSDTFETIHRYSLYQSETQAVEVTQHKVDSTAIWRPRDDWRFSLNGFGLHERVDLDVDTTQYGTLLDVRHHRPVPMGELRLDGGLGFDSARTVGDAGQRVVRGESHVLSGGRLVLLRERYIVPGTILAYNQARTRAYIAGLDYLIIPVGARTQIRRLLSGRIGENEAVLFDYRYVVPAHAEVDRYRADFLAEYAFDFGLTPYYAYEGRCEETDESPASSYVRDNSHRHRLGARFARARWEVGTEYEIFDDSVLPYDAWHTTGRLAWIQEADHSLESSVELSRYLFDDGADDRRVWWFDVDLTDRLQVSSELALRLGGAYRWEDDTFDGQTDAFDLEAGVQFIRGYLNVDLSVEYDLLALTGNRDQSVGVYLNVRRDLGHLLGGDQGEQP